MLIRSLYGTRDAAANFQVEVAKVMKKAGFVVSKASPSVYYHPGRDLKCLVHGDDFISSGSVDDVRWFRAVLEARFELSTQVVGSGAGEVPEARVLNRVIRTDKNGWYYEADQRHGEYIVNAMSVKDAKGAATPGEEAGAATWRAAWSRPVPPSASSCTGRSPARPSPGTSRPGW